MTSYVKQIEAKGIHGRFDMNITLKQGVNIVYGKNGTGKTTLIHILANALNGEYTRFVYLNFDFIRIRLDGATITLQRRTIDGEEHLIAKHGNKNVLKFPIDPITGDLRVTRHRVSPRLMRTLREGELPESEFLRFFERIEPFAEIGVVFDKTEPVLPAAYFPAFRTMIDAWITAHQEQESEREPSRKWTVLATRYARRWFGRFIPSVNYPSLLEIEERLSDDIHQARLRIGRADREYFSEAFLQIFDSLSEDPGSDLQPNTILENDLQPNTILDEIRSLFDRLEASPLQEESMLVTKVYSRLRESIHDLDLTRESERTAVRVLDVYRDLLRRIVDVQEGSFAEIQQYLESVNGFLEGKRLMVDPSIPRYREGAVQIGFDDRTAASGLRVLSSGERQIVTLIYAATHMSEQQVVLIDEPEISLHVDWQRDLLRKMSDQIGQRQIIACTHSPVIAADYEDRQIEIELKETEEPGSS